MAQELSHINQAGEAEMVDVSGKPDTLRRAIACGRIEMGATAFTALRRGDNKKGDVLGTARLAGIMAAKQTAGLIPLCHPLPLHKVAVEFKLVPDACAVEALCTACTTGKTGVEMEALTGVSVALLTVYDMCKALDKGMEITGIHLVEKQGGKSGPYRRE